MYDLVIHNGTIITAVSTTRADVAVQGEQIAAIGRGLRGRQTLNATGLYVVPGAIDIHVHLQMPLPSGAVSADTFLTGTRAAALGGTTTIVDFVAATPDETLLHALHQRRAEADPQVAIDYGLHMTIAPADIAKLDQLQAIVAAGCPTFKLYMAYGFRLHDGQLWQALSAVKAVGGLPVVHAENWEVICTLVARDLAAGRTTPRWHPRSRPALLEAEAVGRIIDLATHVDLPLHIFHVSCAAAVERIAYARARGRPITGETCPHYLFLTQDAHDVEGIAGALPVCAPPLRPSSDNEALWRALAMGHLQLVATDHCPFTTADKARGLANYSRIPGGVPSIEMRLAGVYQGVRRGWLTRNQWVDLCCTTPAKLVGFGRKGDIAVGYDADLVLFDPQQTITLSTQTLHEQVDWTPYDGLALTGWPVTTISRGAIVAEHGTFRGQAGHGRFVPRTLSQDINGDN